MTASTVSGYADAYPIYRDLGWNTIKLEAATKFPPPTGFTGNDGVEPSGADMHTWAEEEPNGNIAIRLSAEYIGIDCDERGDKHGAATIAEAEKRWGKLPYSPASTSRGSGPCNIRLYRIPAGTAFPDVLKFRELGLEDVEIIQRHHRYVVCWPSVHDETGDTYRWHGIDGGEIDPPSLADIPDLPQAWIDALAKPKKSTDSTGLGSDGPYSAQRALTEGEPSSRVAVKLGNAVAACEGGSRHDTIRNHVLGLLRVGKQGEPGVKTALNALAKVFINAVEKDRTGGRDEAETEFRKFVFGDNVSELLADTSYDAGSAEEVGPEFFGEEAPGADPAGDGTPKLAAWCLSRTQLAELPDPEPLIADTLDKNTVGLLYGKWGSGKSFISLDWGLCIAAGKPWQGRAVEQQRVLYIAAEGAHGMKIRTHAWETGWGTTIPDDQFTVLRRAINLTNYSEVKELRALVEWGSYGVVIIDTLARSMVGADENAAKDCGIVVDNLGRILDKTPGGRGLVLGVHHTGKDGKTFRGSSVFEAGADTVYSVLADGPVITLDREKRKDGPSADNHALFIDPIPGTLSCVISAGKPHDESVQGGGQIGNRSARLLSTFVHHFVHTGASKAELRTVADMAPATFHRALSDLLANGDLVNVGTDKRPFYKGLAK